MHAREIHTRRGLGRETLDVKRETVENRISSLVKRISFRGHQLPGISCQVRSSTKDVSRETSDDENVKGERQEM
jgi:hypothetical protein